MSTEEQKRYDRVYKEEKYASRAASQGLNFVPKVVRLTNGRIKKILLWPVKSMVQG